MLSVIVPLYNEENNLKPLYSQLTSVLSSLKQDYEILFVDDGSTDNSFKILESLNKNDKHVKAIRFRRNFGQTAAIDYGMHHAKGGILLFMDADLQNDPNDIPVLLRKLDEGYDLVNGWRYSRKDPFFSKKIPSKISNWLTRKITKVNIHDQGCTLRAIRKEAAKNLKLFGEMHRFIPALVALNGFKVTEVKVRHHERKFGRTKYNFTRIFKGLLDLFYLRFWYTYSTRPLHFFGFLGFLQFALAFLIFIEQIIKALLIGQLTVGPLFILAVLLIITGSLFVIFGFLSEILIRMYYGDRSNINVEKVLD